VGNINYKSRVLFAALIVLLLFYGCEDAGDKTGKNHRQDPIAITHVYVELGSRGAFLEKIREFADHNSFALRATPANYQDDQLLIQLWRDDIRIIGTNPFSSTGFSFGFYELREDVKISSMGLQTLRNDFHAIFVDLKGVQITRTE
jgi:hypothetical protein